MKKASILGGLALSGIPALKSFAETTTPRHLMANDATRNWDVIVIGGNLAGCAAAIAAAKAGATTLLIESGDTLDDSSCQLMTIQNHFKNKTNSIYQGITENVLLDSADNQLKSGKIESWLPVSFVRLKNTYLSLLNQAGVNTLFDSRVVEVKKRKQGIVDSVIVAHNTAINHYKARVFIDCTSNAAVAAWAEAPFLEEGQIAKELFESEVSFVVGNIDYYNYNFCFNRNQQETAKVIEAISQSKEYPALKNLIFKNRLIHSSVIQFYTQYGLRDKFDSVKEKMDAKIIADQTLAAFREYFPETFGSAFLIEAASRVKRAVPLRIKGDYTFTIDDYTDRRSFLDEIGRNNYFADNGRSDTEHILYKENESHGIPYGIMTPVGLKNLLVAGESVSVDYRMANSFRQLPLCLTTGEAAGIAAARVVKMRHSDIRQVNIALIQRGLRKDDQNLI
ncbi:MAG: FAD-dependent oxidoreductase [Bacteroidales bacterium]